MKETDLLDALPVAVYTTDADGRITYYNEAAAELWGCRPELGSSRWCGSWRLFWPDGRPLPHGDCPMAMALKERRPIRGIEAVAERPDGTRLRFLPFPTPLFGDSGELTGAVNLLMDLSDRYRAEAESARLGAIVDSSDDAIVGKTLDGIVTSWNAGATRIFGYQESEMIGQSITRIIPPNLHGQETEILARLRRGEHIDHYETMRVTKDGRRVDISLTVSPVCDRFGNVIGASKVGRDITERKQAEKMQQLLVDELKHRIKNTLATIQAIASQSLHMAKTQSEFVSGFNGRLQALARAHDLLTRSSFEGAEVMQLIREQVLLSDDTSNRISCSGPNLRLDAQTAIQLALVLHELATNARKHGALSVSTGRLSVEWEVHANGGRRTLALDWTERDGPKVSVPQQHGFGTTLIARTLEAQGGTASIRYGRDGVTGQISLPLGDEAQLRSRSGTGSQPASDCKTSARPMGRASNQVNGKRVIIIDDEPLVAMDLESTLQDAGYRVVGAAGTLDEAKRLCGSAECDAALIDANLRGRPVDELVAALTRRNIPFVFVTGYGPDALPQGFQDAPILTKPFRPDELLAAVEALGAPVPGVVRLRRHEN
jgi:PAS domain S-box-containing protein